MARRPPATSSCHWRQSTLLGIRVDPAARPQDDMVASPASQVVSQLRSLLSLGFSGFNFQVSGPDQASGLKRIAEEVLPALRRA